MQGHRNLISIHIPGTLAADVNWRWKVPYDCRIKHASAVANNSDATLALGTSADSDAILAAAAIGDGRAPAEFAAADWAAANPAAVLNRGDVLVVTLDIDGNAGTAAQNATVVLTLLEG
jgi:hypothetical protein